MEKLQADNCAAYHSLKLTRDANGVLVVEFHSNGGPCMFTAHDHTECVDAFYRIAQDRANKIVILTGAGGEFMPGVAAEGATFHDVPHFAGGIVPGDGILTTWSYRAGAA